MSSRERVLATRRVLVGAIWLRAALWTAASWLAFEVAARIAPWVGAPPRTPFGFRTLGVLVSVIVAGALLRGAFAISVESVALWIEERLPGLRYALVTAVDPRYYGTTPARALEAEVARVSWGDQVRRSVLRAALPPVGVLLTLVITTALLRARTVVAPLARDVAGSERPAGGRRSSGGPFASLRAVVTPPAYARRSPTTINDPAALAALPGSAIELSAEGSASEFRAEHAGASVPVRQHEERWQIAIRVGAAPVAIRLVHQRGERLITVEPRADSAPLVTLALPARDTVLRHPRGALTVAGDASDDIGLVTGSFEYIVSSGEGESFDFRSGVLAATSFAFATKGALRGTLSLDALKLGAGDVVHLRAVARDGNTVSGPGVGASETRVVRVARLGEYDSVAVEGAAPPEADRSLLSQRMLIVLTEALEKRRRSLDRTTLLAESRTISRDQTRLRKFVGEIVFSRLGDDPTGEHFHGDGHEHTGDTLRPPLTPDEVLKAADAATGRAAGEVLDVEDETPVVAINRPLLEAYNAMWEATRELDQGETGRALPPMRVALAAIQRARRAERIYLRGRPPQVVVDLARVRLQGQERGTSSTREPSPALDPTASRRLARFVAVLALLRSAPAAAADSLLLLRLETLPEDPRSAEALGEAVAALRGSRDATDALLRAGRALSGGFRIRHGLSPWRHAW